MQEDFLRLLMTLAQACKFQLSKDLMAIYDGMAEKKGYESAADAVKHYLINRGTNDPFPSVKDLLEQISPELVPALPEDEARAAAARAISAVRKFGRTNPIPARSFIGELGWRAIDEMGGWSSFCSQLTIDKISTYQSQLTALALSIFRRSQKGLLDVAPPLPKPIGGLQVRMLPPNR